MASHRWLISGLSQKPCCGCQRLQYTISERETAAHMPSQGSQGDVTRRNLSLMPVPPPDFCSGSQSPLRPSCRPVWPSGSLLHKSEAPSEPLASAPPRMLQPVFSPLLPQPGSTTYLPPLTRPQRFTLHPPGFNKWRQSIGWRQNPIIIDLICSKWFRPLCLVILEGSKSWTLSLDAVALSLGGWGGGRVGVWGWGGGGIGWCCFLVPGYLSANSAATQIR